MGNILSRFCKILVALLVLAILLFFVIQAVVLCDVLPYTHFLNIMSLSLVLGSCILVYVIFNDLQNRNALREEVLHAQLKDINAQYLIAVYDIDGNFISTNNNMRNLLGYTSVEFDKMHRRSTLSQIPGAYDDNTEFIQKLYLGEIVDGQFEKRTKSGNVVWVYSKYAMLKDPSGQYTNIIEIGTDQTEMHNAQADILQKNSYLEYAAKILRHDMHSGINTYIPRGIRSLKRRLSSQQIRDLNIETSLKLIEQGLEHTQKVYKGVREFTNLVRYEGAIEKRELDLGVLLRNHISKSAYSKSVIIDKLVVANVNDSLFCTAIENLIQNGLKYNNSPTRVVHIYMEDDLTLCIMDNGIGMSHPEFEYYSRPYTRNPDNTVHGSGLGLNICIAILNIHGFTINAEKLEVGTKLRIKLRSI